MKNKKNQAAAPKASKKNLGAKMYKYRGFYLMFLPVFIFAVIFFYLPMLGVRYAFTSYNGIKAATFIGLQNFQKMFSMPNFWSAFINTLEISIIKLVLTTVVAVVVSIFLNEIINIHFKKIVQTIIYLPHFMSWVVTASVFSLILAPTSQGLVNTFLVNIGVLDSSSMIYFLGNSKWWRFSYYIINIWKETGWQTVIFMATLAGINTELYEAASIDGAGRWGKMRYIYYQTFNSGAIPNYGYTTAIGLFKSLVGCILVLACNHLSKKIRDGRGIV